MDGASRVMKVCGYVLSIMKSIFFLIINQQLYFCNTLICYVVKVSVCDKK
ncbi:hypothetical protein IB211_01343c [Intestinimonas butyriciproducens]|uniref:Uncharacterized protein n=1 Tax=Intestinimonas butyriciproducens TaxID=1297617 RepID=A0A0S2W2Z7_9FIRM|nr:hypothetical protein IB211_01343c [Intestinimonas butyriciproducens]